MQISLVLHNALIMNTPNKSVSQLCEQPMSEECLSILTRNSAKLTNQRGSYGCVKSPITVKTLCLPPLNT